MGELVGSCRPSRQLGSITSFNHGGFLWFNPVRPIVFAAGSSNLLQHNPDIQ